MKKIIVVFACVTVVLLGFAAVCMGYTAPAAGDFLYDMYDMFYAKMVEGSVGGMVTGGAIAAALYSLIRGSMAGFGIGIVSAGCIFKLEDIVTSLGFLM